MATPENLTSLNYREIRFWYWEMKPMTNFRMGFGAKFFFLKMKLFFVSIFFPASNFLHFFPHLGGIQVFTSLNINQDLQKKNLKYLMFGWTFGFNRLVSLEHRKIAKMPLFTPACNFNFLGGQMRIFEVLWACHLLTESKIYIRLSPSAYLRACLRGWIELSKIIFAQGS